MQADPSEAIVGAMMAVFGLVGLIVAAHALDDEMYVFGLSLVGFAAAFIFGLLRVHYDREHAKVVEAVDHV